MERECSERRQIERALLRVKFGEDERSVVEVRSWPLMEMEHPTPPGTVTFEF